MKLMKKTLETEAVLFEIEKGILIATYKPNVKISLKQAKAIVEQRLAFIDNIPKPTLVLNSGTLNADKSARDFFSSEEGVAGIKCAALMANSNFTSLMLTFFLKITKPKLLVKTFTEKKDALIWLSNYID
jgi:hypothetical protein